MRASASPGFPWLRCGLVAVGLWLTLSVAARHVLWGPPVLEVGDLAVNALQIDQAKSGREWYGNYSRFQFNHPGPAFFYVYALSEIVAHDLLRLTRSPHQAHLWASLALQAGFAAVALTLLSLRLNSPLALPALAIVSAAYFGWKGTVFTSLWPPYVLAIPFLCLLAACASTGSGRPRHLLIAAFAGGFLVHGHVAQPLLVGGLLLVTLLLLLAWGGAEAEAHTWSTRHTMSLILLGGMFTLPLALDFLAHGLTGNTATIVRRFVTNTEDAKTPLQSLLYFVSFATPTRDQDLLLREVGRGTWLFFQEHRAWLIGWGVVFFLPPLLYVRLHSRLAATERRFALSSYVLWAGAVVLCVAWGVAQAGPMFHYNGAFFISVYGWPVLLLAIGAARLTQVRRVVVPAGLMLVGAVVVLLLRFTLPPLSPEARGEPVRTAVGEVLRESTRPAKVLHFDAEAWPVAAAVGLALQRQGVEWYTMARWNFMFQERHDLEKLGAPPKLESWLVRTTEEPESITLQRLPAPVVPGETVIDHAENFDAYALWGLEVTRPAPVFTVKPTAGLLLRPGTAPGDVRVVFDAEANDRIPDGPALQPADIYFNNQHLGTIAVGPRAEVSVRVPEQLWNSHADEAVLELRFPEGQPDQSFTRPRARDTYAWALWGIRFEHIR
jgi:hypothetical protein